MFGIYECNCYCKYRVRMTGSERRIDDVTISVVNLGADLFKSPDNVTTHGKYHWFVNQLCGGLWFEKLMIKEMR
jgi:hypothetical protein